MQALDQWVAWRRSGDNKIPINPHTYRPADHGDPNTWGSYAQALDAAQRMWLEEGGRWNVGFVFGLDDPFTGWDMDDCYDPRTGELTPEARQVVGLTKTYAEVSPSLRGVKGISRAKLPRNLPGGHGLEIYSKDRFFTITGSHLPGTPDTITEGQKALEWLYERYDGNRGVQREADGPSRKLGEGQGRNSRLTTLAGKLRRAGLSTEAVGAALKVKNPKLCDPPLPDEEIANTASLRKRNLTAPSLRRTRSNSFSDKPPSLHGRP